MTDDTPSVEGSGEDHGFFRRHWKALAAVTGVSTVITVGAVFAVLGWYDPSILSVLLSWPMLILGTFAGLTLLAGFIVYWYTDTDSVTTFIRRTTGDTTNQLTAYEAEKLAEWIVYHQYDILVGETIDSGVVPVTTADEGVTTRIFEWEFSEKNSADDYVYLIDLEQPVEFDPDWVEERTPDHEAKANTAMRHVYNTRLLTNPDRDDITDARESLGNSVRRQEIVEKIDEDGQTTERIKRDRTVIPADNTETAS